MDLPRAQRVAIMGSELINDELIEHPLDVLEIRHVAACSNHSVGSHRLETLNVLESGERSI